VPIELKFEKGKRSSSEKVRLGSFAKRKREREKERERE
jgi:hypothetical protein